MGSRDLRPCRCGADGKALRLRKTLIIEDAHGRKLARIQERMMRIKDAMEVEDAEGNRLAMIKKPLVSPIRLLILLGSSDAGRTHMLQRHQAQPQGLDGLEDTRQVVPAHHRS